MPFQALDTTYQKTSLVQREDATGKIWKQVVAAAELTAKTPYKIILNEYGYTTAALGSSGAFVHIGVPAGTVASGAIDWIQIGGYCADVITPSLSVSVGHALQLDANGAIADSGVDYTGKPGQFAVVTAASTTSTTQDVILNPEFQRDGTIYDSNVLTSNGIPVRRDIELQTITGQTYGQYNLITTTGVGYAGARSVVGQVTNTATQTAAGGWQLLTGVCGVCQNTGTWTNTTLFAMAGTFQQAGGGTITAVSHMACVWLDWSNASTVSAGNTEMMYITNNAVSGASDMDQVFYIHASLYSAYKYLFYFDACELGDGFIDYQNVKTTHGGTYRNIKVSIGGTEYFIIVSDTPT